MLQEYEAILGGMLKQHKRYRMEGEMECVGFVVRSKMEHRVTAPTSFFFHPSVVKDVTPMLPRPSFVGNTC